MPKLIDISGKRFGFLKVVKQSKKRFGLHRGWQCLCDYGKISIVSGTHLRSGHTTSCGCRCHRRLARTFHGATKGGKRTPEYNTWLSMHGRCYNSNAKRFKHYGGRGIKVCERWHDFKNFLTDMGSRPGGKQEYSIERIDVDGHYEPSNCIWLPLIDQNKNRRRREPWKDIGISRGYYYRKFGKLGPK